MRSLWRPGRSNMLRDLQHSRHPVNVQLCDSSLAPQHHVWRRLWLGQSHQHVHRVAPSAQQQTGATRQGEEPRRAFLEASVGKR